MSQLASDSAASTDASMDSAKEDEADTTEEESADEEAGEEEAGDEFPLDQVFGILKNSRRRQVLEYVADAEGQVSLSEVAEQIAAWENDKEVRQITSSERKRVYVGLYQCHLPKMDAMGIISFNKPRGTIELEDGIDVFYDYLDTAEESDDPPWHVYSVALSVAGASVLGAAMLVRPLTTLPAVDLAVGAVILSFLVYAAASLQWQRSERADAESADV